MSQFVVRLPLHNSLDLVLTFHNGPAKRRAQLERLVSWRPNVVLVDEANRQSELHCSSVGTSEYTEEHRANRFEDD